MAKWERAALVLIWAGILGLVVETYALDAQAQQPATNWIGFVVACQAGGDAKECVLLAEASVGANRSFDALGSLGIAPLPPPVGWLAQGMCMIGSAGVLRLLVAQDSMGAHHFPTGSDPRVFCLPAAVLQREGYPVPGWDYGFCRRHPYDETCQQMWTWMQAWNEGLIP